METMKRVSSEKHGLSPHLAANKYTCSQGIITFPRVQDSVEIENKPMRRFSNRAAFQRIALASVQASRGGIAPKTGIDNDQITV
jgi:hypothetical protein